MAIGLKFFSAIKLMEYQISYWRIQKTLGLSDIGTRPQCIRLSDIGLRKNYRLPTSDDNVVLLISACMILSQFLTRDHG
jgi:hypothetical protein